MGTGGPIEGLQGTEIKDDSSVIRSRFVKMVVSFRFVKSSRSNP